MQRIKYSILAVAFMSCCALYTVSNFVYTTSKIIAKETPLPRAGEMVKPVINKSLIQEHLYNTKIEQKRIVNNQAQPSSQISENLNLANEFSTKKEADTILQDIDNEKSKPINPSTISIPQIGLNSIKVVSANLDYLDDLYIKMEQNPVLETTYSGDFCTKRSYVMGHSEPSYSGQKGRAINIFRNLEILELGDIFEATDSQGKTCQYKVIKWDFVTTNTNDEITEDQFKYVFYPNYSGNILTIQTCKKGSSTVRLLLRAEQII
jgi:Sortase domain